MLAARLGDVPGCEMLSPALHVSGGLEGPSPLARTPPFPKWTRKRRFLPQIFTNIHSNPRHLFVSAVANQSGGEN